MSILISIASVLETRTRQTKHVPDEDKEKRALPAKKSGTLPI